MVKPMTNACYRCIHRRNAVDAAAPLTACGHPDSWVSLGERIPSVVAQIDRDISGPPLNVRAATRGVLAGYFQWPIIFNPIYLVHCDGFVSSEPVEAAA
jgi:hypothetical protein